MQLQPIPPIPPPPPLQPELAHFGDNRRFAAPISPYRRGFEDYRYDHVYANPYPIGSADWRRYNDGNLDARRQGALL